MEAHTHLQLRPSPPRPPPVATVAGPGDWGMRRSDEEAAGLVGGPEPEAMAATTGVAAAGVAEEQLRGGVGGVGEPWGWVGVRAEGGAGRAVHVHNRMAAALTGTWPVWRWSGAGACLV